MLNTGKNVYRGSPPYAFFGTWKKPCYMKLMLVGLYCGPLLTLIPPLTCFMGPKESKVPAKANQQSKVRYQKVDMIQYF